MRASSTILLVALSVNMVTGCATPEPRVRAIAARPVAEEVTPRMWQAAQRQAARLSHDEISLAGAKVPQINHLPIKDLCELIGRCPHAAAYDLDSGVVYFRNDRPWGSDRGHHFGIVIHEAVHSMQPNGMSQGCREHQAHDIQAAWLDELGEPERAAAVRENANKYSCGDSLAAMTW